MFQWTHDRGAINLSMVIIYSIVDSIAIHYLCDRDHSIQKEIFQLSLHHFGSRENV